MKMKREYTKPVVELVRFELNEAIAACDIKIYVDLNDGVSCRVNTLFGDSDFQDEVHCKKYEGFIGYCYYSATDGIPTFNS